MDIIEQLASALHDGWLQHQEAQGCSFGPNRDRSARKHPHFVPWSALDVEAKNQDRFQAAFLLLKWKSEGIADEDLPHIIHEAWRAWEQISRTFAGLDRHPHDGPFSEKHAHGPDEHAIQARLVSAIFEKAKNRT